MSTTDASPAPPVLRTRGLSKSFGAIQALIDVDLDVASGEVVALVGDNGAGKSTLVKVVSGVHQATSGHVELDGNRLEINSPKEAREHGIETVYQDLALVEELDVAGNFFLGKEEFRGGLLGRMFGVLGLPSMRDRAEAAIRELHVRIPDVTQPVANMSGGQRQGVAIGRAAFWGRRVLILDEPTAALGVDQSEEVLALIERLAEVSQLAVLLISHNMQDVTRVADRIVVLRQGRKVADLDRRATDSQEVVGYITGAISPAAS
jgi:ABC-type sugar transport system ATPase subunit